MRITGVQFLIILDDEHLHLIFEYYVKILRGSPSHFWEKTVGKFHESNSRLATLKIPIYTWFLPSASALANGLHFAVISDTVYMVLLSRLG